MDDAIAMLERDSGSHFDPQLVSAFVTIAPALYNEVSGLEEQQMVKLLQHHITRHFLASAINTGIKPHHSNAV